MPSPALRRTPPAGAGPVLRRLVAALTVLVLALGAALAGPLPAAADPAAGLTRVTSFGANPGALHMYVHRPASLPAAPPVVVALHGCTQGAQVYADGSGLARLADRYGFLLVLAEQTAANNPNKCFNWFRPADSRRGQGEAASIRQMVAHAVAAHGADARRVHVTGLSAGGAMTSVLLAAYPDVFSSGAVIAGLPQDCARDTAAAYTCMNPGVDLTPAQWAQRVRDAHPSWAGPWPRVAIWHGDRDTTVVPRNADELRDQWTAVHGLSQTPTRTDVIGPNATRREQYAAPDGTVAVEVAEVPGMGHGTPVDPGPGPEQCGVAGTHFPDTICSGHWIAEFFGLDGSGGGPGTPPAPSGLAVTGATGSTITLTWSAVDGATGYTLYRDGAPVATPAAPPYTDTGLATGTDHTYAVAARDRDGRTGALSAPVTARTTGGSTASCWTDDNYGHVRAGRATTRGGYTFAKGSDQAMGLYNTFVGHTLRESPAGHFTLADDGCAPAPVPPAPSGAATTAPAAAPGGRTVSGCPASLRVPGAAHQRVSCLDELTTAGTVASGHTDPADWAGLTPKDLPAPSGVPGVQIDGYFPDTSATNTNHGWMHDAQFVLRLPDRWNGGLVVSGTPGNREQYANDRAIGDWVLSRGYAFATTDKGNTGTSFQRDGRRPGDAIAEWNTRLTQLTRAARAVVAQRYHRPPARTLATGMSNGGYLVRWQLENHPELYDGGVDWEGTLWRADGPHLFTFLPPALRHYPVYAAGGPAAGAARRAMHSAGYPAGSEFLWPYHHTYYWGLTQRIYREELDPGYPGADADYDWAARPERVRGAVDRIALTGRIGKPLMTVHGTLDVLLPITQDSDVYARMVREAGRGGLHRYYRVEGGTHTDALVDAFPDRLRPLVPCHRSAFTALEGWIGRGERPPAGRTVPQPAGAGAAELLAGCRL
jgi:poly(hydroxyalkanoate) depolymerase family esterase